MRDVIIDTDPGLDDAVAILHALGHPGLHVLGVTTVAGNIGLDLTTANACGLVAVAGHAGPVIPGAAVPLGRAGIDAREVHGDDGLGGVVLPAGAAPLPGPAHAWIAATLRTRPPGSVTLLTLGPLTNLALMLRAAPDAAARLGPVIAMGGAVDAPGNQTGPDGLRRAEFNFAFDPEAVAEVLAAGLDLTLIPLDVTRAVRADAAFLARLAKGGPRARTAAAVIGAYLEGHADTQSRPLHDPCVPVLALDPSPFRIETRRLGVELEGGHAGALVPGAHPVRCALGVDAPAVLDRLAEGLV
jgi:purine nucleosidase/pyrimidine-specific ribonucleoside hydrolase